MNNTEIVEAVKDGMKKSASVTFLMNFSSGGTINTEYVATVSIGLSLVESKYFSYDDDKIIFECPTGEFISATVPVLKMPDDNSSKKIVRKVANTTRPGRIDIAIYDSKSCFDKPKCAIEVKGDHPAKSLLLSDIRRNLEYFQHAGPTGTSNLELTLNCSFHSYNIPSSRNYCITTQHESERKKTLKKRYQKYINELKSEIPNYISVRTEIFTATSLLLSPDATQEEYELHMDNLHLTLGVLIIFERNLASSN